MNSTIKLIIIVLFIKKNVNGLPILNTLNNVPTEAIQYSSNLGSSQYKAIRISEKMCNLYSANIKKLRLQSTKTLSNGFAEKPYVALIGWESVNEIAWDCTGFLVSESFVITAAHCVGGNPVKQIKAPPTHIRLGQQDISSINLKKSVDLKILQIFTNPKRKQSNVHDIALIKFLSLNFKFNKLVQPICLPTKSNYNIKQFFAYGWGTVTKEFNVVTRSKNISSSRTEILKEVKLEETSSQDCSNTFNSPWYRMFDKNFNYCAKPINMYQDTCQGDSGGPIVIKDPKKNIEVAIGLTSRGYSFCNNQSHEPIGVYLRLFPYLNWIEETVWIKDFSIIPYISKKTVNENNNYSNLKLLKISF